MPKVFEWNGYRFFFFSNEGRPLERCHIHVRKGEQLAKFMVDPSVELVSAWGMHSSELTRLEEVVSEQAEVIRRTWHEYFGA